MEHCCSSGSCGCTDCCSLYLVLYCSNLISLSSGVSTANLSCWLVLIRCNLLCLSSGVSAAILSHSRVLFCCEVACLSYSSLSSAFGTIPLPLFSQPFAPCFRCLCSTLSSLPFVSVPSLIFLLMR